MAIHIIIDGYNLIRRSSFFSEFDLQDLAYGRQALIDALIAYKKSKPHKITVVFDGTHSFDNLRRREQIKGIIVLFSRQGEEADHVIKRIADSEKQRALVVSSDRDVIDYVETKGASVIGTSAFEAKILMTGATDSGDGQMDADTREWDPSMRKKGPSRRLSKKKRQDLRRIGKL